MVKEQKLSPDTPGGLSRRAAAHRVHPNPRPFPASQPSPISHSSTHGHTDSNTYGQSKADSVSVATGNKRAREEETDEPSGAGATTAPPAKKLKTDGTSGRDGDGDVDETNEPVVSRSTQPSGKAPGNIQPLNPLQTSPAILRDSQARAVYDDILRSLGNAVEEAGLWAANEFCASRTTCDDQAGCGPP